MNCVVCGKEADGHWVVVRIDSATPVGAFCHRCDDSMFGACLERFELEAPDTCVLCGGSGAYEFRDWVENTGSGDVGEKASASQGPVFCALHFQSLTATSADWTGERRATRQGGTQ